ncbi:hypothetical protein D9M71_791160 [compost metagenome]
MIRIEPFFIARISFSPIIHWVDGSSGTCSETMSARPSSSFRLVTWVALPSGSLVSGSKKNTCMPRLSARTDSWVPIEP